MWVKDFSTIALEKSVLEKLKTLNVDYHGIEMDSNSKKIDALINLYNQNYKNI